MEVNARNAGAAVLIVDDDPVCRLFCVKTLAASGYRSISAVDGESAIYLAIQNQPEVVLTDLHLPDTSGTELISRIRTLWPAFLIPPCCIAISGDDSTETRTAVRNAGFSDVLTKPFPAEALLSCVAKAEHQSRCSSKIAQQDRAWDNPAVKQPRNSLKPELQTMFRLDLHQQVAEIDHLLTSRDWQRAADLLHRLSGAAALAGFYGLAGQGRQLMQLLCDPKDIALLAQTYLDFLREVSQACENGSHPA